VYGVWLEGHEQPVYIGQTLEGRRRLWDLPIGESHHLANSFPPEIWSRVVVVYWGQALARRPDLLANITAKLAPIIDSRDLRKSIGLGLEHLLQRRYQPLFNRRRKRRDACWREVAWETSASIGAKAAPFLDELLATVVAAWEQLAGFSRPIGPIIELPEGRAVFPAALTLGAPDSPNQQFS
jgi:hypothetical protein